MRRQRLNRQKNTCSASHFNTSISDDFKIKRVNISANKGGKMESKLILKRSVAEFFRTETVSVLKIQL